jgi:uncharacterized membrane protein YphA (DoxX/SURF4 family)
MERLFSSFARGIPGIGLLIARVVCGLDLMVQTVMAVRHGGTLAYVLEYAALGGSGILLLLGLWTRVVAGLISLATLVYFFNHANGWNWVLLGIVGIALTVLGPGAWSVDARRSGWKRIEIPRR